MVCRLKSNPRGGTQEKIAARWRRGGRDFRTLPETNGVCLSVDAKKKAAGGQTSRPLPYSILYYWL
jgi:hypothetical protein